MKKLSKLLTLATAFLLPIFIMAQDKSDDNLIKESNEAKASFQKADPSMENLFRGSYGYAIFPNIGKGAFGVGGAGGKGVVYQKRKAIGTADMIQVTIGAQAGGQAYREVIFFESKEALERFQSSKFEFAAQTSAVAVKSGASANANYRDGVVVFTQEKGGLMLEASLGGQKFTYKSMK